MENIKIIDHETISIFVPIEIKKKGGTATIILPKNVKMEDQEKYYDEKLIKAIAKAYKWKMLFDEGKISSLAEISQKENITSAYAGRIFNLNHLSPEIVERILNGTQPRNLKLKNIILGTIPELWQEQKEKLGF